MPKPGGLRLRGTSTVRIEKGGEPCLMLRGTSVHRPVTSGDQPMGTPAARQRPAKPKASKGAKKGY